MDELAHAAGQDPLEFRRKLMANHPKHLAVLNAVAERAGWGKPAPQGVFRGIAQQMGYGSYVAACAEISLGNDGKLKLHRIVAATDCGYAVNPAQIERQINGSFVYGLSALLYGGITIKDGRIEQENFDSYNVMRISEMPKVESIIMPSGGFWAAWASRPSSWRSGGVNAIFAATGKRRTFLSEHNIRTAQHGAGRSRRRPIIPGADHESPCCRARLRDGPIPAMAAEARPRVSCSGHPQPPV